MLARVRVELLVRGHDVLSQFSLGADRAILVLAKFVFGSHTAVEGARVENLEDHVQ